MRTENTLIDKILHTLKNNVFEVMKCIVAIILFIVQIILIKDENTVFWSVFVFMLPTLVDYGGLIRKFPDEINAPRFKTFLLVMLCACGLFFASMIVVKAAVEGQIKLNLPLWVQFFRIGLFLYPVATCHLLIGDIIINENINQRIEDSQDNKFENRRE